MSESVITFEFTKKQLKQIKKDILEGIDKALADMEAAESFFQNTTDSKLIEVAIFYKQAAVTRYEYLLTMAKQYDISITAKDLINKNSIQAYYNI
ncbi:Protein of unknown function [Clostridium amylolyticum]|uniref:DUF2508 family protein n=1 Tax=Clostridium amylolyticum TaxID=1121298 RepID=A0A1M6NWP8_9CLOT|nr:DUF2508 family protein [Clostridium amylolyticum]SHK00054.1 Protein of unknown function [Clostridium amylolyticum]